MQAGVTPEICGWQRLLSPVTSKYAFVGFGELGDGVREIGETVGSPQAGLPQ